MRNFLFLISLLTSLSANAFVLEFSNTDFSTTPQFSNVTTFQFKIEVEGDLQAGVYNDPVLLGVEYSVSGSLAANTPSGFPMFALQRTITGSDFYLQGSSLNFEILTSADLSDGLQADELVGGTGFFVFNGREVGNGRFHPALFELNSDGSGRIQNSNNVIATSPFNDVNFGDEYITVLMFDPGNLTLGRRQAQTTPTNSGGGGSSSYGVFLLLLLMMFGLKVACLVRQYGLSR